jgi:hypothetical protein
MSLNSISYVKIGGHVYESKFLLRQDTLLKRLYGLGAIQDIILYDFTRQVGDTSAGSALLSIDTVLLSDGKKHLRQKFHGAPHISNNPYYVIEGVGCLNGLLDYKGAADFEQKSWLTCLFDIKLNQPVYKNSQSVCSGDVGLKTLYDCQPKIAFNPSHSSLSLQLCYATPHIEIIDVYGRTVKVIEAGIGTFDLSVSDLPGGFYLLRAFGPTTERYGRFIKSQ